jgi:hypothetical protein
MMVIMVSVRHMIKSILNYLRWSNLSIMFILNPVSWGLDFDYRRPDDFNPKMHQLIIRLLMFRIEFIVDDGSW